MKTIQIKNRFTEAVLFTTEVADDDAFPMRSALKAAIAAGADLADADLAGADLADAYLADANLADANLARANLAGANLARANLAGAYLARANLADAYLARAYLADAYLADANLARANLAGADLAGADLADADGPDPATPRTDPPEPYVRAKTPEERKARQLAYAQRYRERHPEVPVVEQLDKRILDAITAEGCHLEMGSWHGGEHEDGTACGTTHCRGGWAIMLAGADGLKLEREHGVERAASMIYRASTGRVPHFYASNERALEDIKRCAAEAVTP